MYVSSTVHFLLINAFSSPGITHERRHLNICTHALEMLQVYKDLDY